MTVTSAWFALPRLRQYRALGNLARDMLAGDLLECWTFDSVTYFEMLTRGRVGVESMRTCLRVAWGLGLRYVLTRREMFGALEAL